MIRRISFLSCLIFISGFCSLVYQVAWIREFRLVFGGTTAAGAAVLAIFMGGLGAGAAFYGRRAGAAANPLRLYGLLEIAVTAAALISPVLLGAARAIYDASGGEMALGVPLATAIRLGLATLVLGPACFFMGGNLPAGITFVAAARDPGRRRLARLYGLNTLGAVAGAALSTFWMLEHLGTRATLYTACGANAVIGIAALLASFAVETGAGANPARSETVAPAASRPFVFAAAFTAGFVFFLLELVWYRMLIPLIGGSVYSLGMILVMALSGIGAGGLLYSLRPADKSVSLRGFAAAAALFALAAALAFAAGDRLVIVAYHAGGLRVFGFTGQILAWSVPAAIVVLGPALLAGYQFPYLVALLGRGREGIGRDTGAAYAWNTCGAIAGALLGGLVLIPELGAIGCWRLAVGLMLALAGAALVFGWERSRTAGAKMPLGAILTMLATSLAISGSGPSAAWRHSPVGFGRVERIPKNVNEFEDWKRQMNRRVRYEIEGRESCIALSATDGFTFIVNGKTDGGAVGDSGTQVMLGLLASLFHPDPESACVIGLGTGTTAGWLAEVPAIQEVDVIELEPGMRRVAREFAPMNRDLLEKPGVRVLTGDAREILPTIERRYDIVISGPSNLSRAGVPNLYTKEFYRSVRERMNDGAIFAQWVQAYEVDARSIAILYATLCDAFGSVESWSTEPNDLVFICSGRPLEHSRERIEKRIAQEPYVTVLRNAWKVDTLEGLYAHMFANADYAREIAVRADAVNTDDRNLVEFGFARGLVRRQRFQLDQIAAGASRSGMRLPTEIAHSLDLARVGEEWRLFHTAALGPFPFTEKTENEKEAGRAKAREAYVAGRHAEVLREWKGIAQSPMEKLMLAESAAVMNHPRGEPMAKMLAAQWPIESNLYRALLRFHGVEYDRALGYLEEALWACRRDPWPRERTLELALGLVGRLSAAYPPAADPLFDILSEPFVLEFAREGRLKSLMELSAKLGPAQQVRAVDAWGEQFPWGEKFLRFREASLEAAGDARAPGARRDYRVFRKRQDEGFEMPEGVLPAIRVAQ